MRELSEQGERKDRWEPRVSQLSYLVLKYNIWFAPSNLTYTDCRLQGNSIRPCCESVRDGRSRIASSPSCYYLTLAVQEIGGLEDVCRVNLSDHTTTVEWIK